MKKLLGITAAAAALSALAAAQDAADGNASDEADGGGIRSETAVTQFGDWTRVCAEDGTDAENCQLQHSIQNEGGGRVATVEVFRLPPGSEFAAGAAVALPLGVSLADGLELRIGGAPTRRFSFAICVADGCLSRIGLSELAVEQLSAGADVMMTVQVGLAADRAVDLMISTNGFAEAFAALMDGPDPVQEAAGTAVAQGEVIAEPQVEMFGDWARSCLVSEDGSRNCRIQQIILNQSGGALAVIDMFRIDGHDSFTAGAEIIVPHGVSVADGLEVQIDSAIPMRYDFTTCMADGCLAQFGVTGAVLERMKAGSKMHVVFYTTLGGAGERQVDFNASLIGFTKAFDSL